MNNHRYIAITTVLLFGLLVWFVFRADTDSLNPTGRAIAEDSITIENTNTEATSASSATPVVRPAGGHSTKEIMAWIALFAIATVGFIILSRLQRRRSDAFKAAQQRDKAQSRSDSHSDSDSES